jgi:hypothetical protein
VLVMVGGRVVAQGPTEQVLADPATRALGIAEPTEVRLRRLLAEDDLDGAAPGSSLPGAR